MNTGIIKDIRAYEILTGNGKPTVEVELQTDSQQLFTASVPSGTSKGGYEAYELLDGGARYQGKGNRQAAANVNEVLKPLLVGKSLADPAALDRLILDADGTPDKHRLGGNAILPVSAAIYKAASACAGLPLYRFVGGAGATRLPAPIATVIAGGVHSASPQIDFEDFICVAQGFNAFSEALEAIVNVRATLERQLKGKYPSVTETGGALACPHLESNESAIEAILSAINACGFTGKMSIGLDVAANELHDASTNLYRVKGKQMTVDRLIDYYVELAGRYPVSFIEDPFEENDFTAFQRLRTRTTSILIVGDDLYASNAKRLAEGIRLDATNAILLKINQIGSISEAIATAQMAAQHEQCIIVSLRSNDTCDPMIADFAIGVGAAMIKLGSPVRGERVAKYNRLLAIEDQLNNEHMANG